MNSELLQGFYLGSLFVEPLKGQVTGPEGARHLAPKAVEVLLCLTKTPGELVTREDLLETVWGASNGSQEALGHAISEIRHAFDDHREDPHYIQTLPKRGYRLLAEPNLSKAEQVSAPQTGASPGLWTRLLRHGVIQAAAAYLVVGWLLIQVADTTFEKIGLPPWSEHLVTFVVIGGFPLLIVLTWFLEFVGGRMEHDFGQQRGGLLHGLERNYLAIFIAYGLSAVGGGVYQATVGFDVTTTQTTAQMPAEPELIPVTSNSLAVLRLATFDDDAQTKAFSDGLSEDILDGLARLPGLVVSARGDSWSLPANSPSSIVRQRLRVANYIEGSVRFLDDQLKVVIQLIDSETGFHLFSRSFEIEIAAIGDMQRTITELVVANLKLAVDESGFEPSAYPSDVTDRDAYLLYMLGREAANRPATIQNIELAISFFDQALTIDAEYPAANAGLCGAHLSLYELQEDTASIETAESACAAALSTGSKLRVVLHSVARLYRKTGKAEEAEKYYLAALDLSEQDAAAMIGLALIRRGQQQYGEAERLMQRAIELQPGNWSTINNLGNLYFRTSRFADAAAEYRKVVYLDPGNYVTLGNLASTGLMSGKFSIARDALLAAIEIEESSTLVANLGIAHYYLGNFDSAVKSLRKAVELAPNSPDNWISLGDALHASGSAGESNSAYVRGRELAAAQLAVDSDDADTLTALAWSTAATGDLVNGAALSERAVDIDPKYPYSHYYAALIALRRGDITASILSVELALNNGYPVAMLAAEPILKELWKDSRFVELMARHSTGG